MSAMTFSTGPDLNDALSSLEKLRTKLAPLATVIVAHAILFYFIYSGLFTRMVDVALPKAVMVAFVPLEEKAPPAAPKVVPVVQLADRTDPVDAVTTAEAHIQPTTVENHLTY